MKRKKFVNQKSVARKFGIRNDQRKSFKRKKSKAGICLTERVGTNKKEKLQMRNGRSKRAKRKGRKIKGKRRGKINRSQQGKKRNKKGETGARNKQKKTKESEKEESKTAK